jgi:acetylglutamate kinase
MIKVGIAGATGYVGIELIHILLNHPKVKVVSVATQSHIGVPLVQVFDGDTSTNDMLLIMANGLKGNPEIHMEKGTPLMFDEEAALKVLSQNEVVIDLGFVGQINQVNSELLKTLTNAGYIPVIAPIATSLQALAFNINADSAASEIAKALNADHLVFLSDVPGVLSDPQDATTKIDTIRSHEVKALIASGKLSGGMIPKTEGAFAALEEGVGEVHILDGRVAHSLLLHFHGEKPMGTTFKL